MALGKSAVIKIVLNYIGGSMLTQIPTTTIGGMPVAIKAGGLGGLASLASSVASAVGGLQAGLTAVSQNPLGAIINGAKDTLINLSTGGYAGLDAAIPAVASNPALSAAYDALKVSLGGADGLSGAVAQLDKFQEHTDRLSGVTLPSDSENAVVEESGSDYIYYFDMLPNQDIAVVTFSAKKFRSAKYFIQGSAGNEHQTSEVFVIHDNSKVYAREVDLIYTQDPFITFTSKLEDNTISVLANTSISNTDIVIYGVKLEVATPAEAKNEIGQEKILESARTMAGFYPEDTTNYVEMQAGSLFKQNLVAELSREIDELTIKMKQPDFIALSDAEKETYIYDLANTINMRSQSLQESIDSDINAYLEVNKKIEAASILSNITSSYSDPQAKALLDLTLQSSVKADLQ